MLALIWIVLAALALPFKSKRRLEAENAILRQQIIVLRRQVRGRVKLTNLDRAILVQPYRWFPRVLRTIVVVRPETVIRWHRAGFRAYWRWKSRRRGGRPRVDAELRMLIRQMSLDNPLWGAPRIHGELLKLGYEVAQSTVAKYMIRRRGWPGQDWRTFLPWGEAPLYLIRDNDALYGSAFTRRLRAMGIRDRPIALGSPWQNGIVERLIGSLRRECLDHVLIFSEVHLRRILGEYGRYYNAARAHRSLKKDAPLSRAVQRAGKMVSRSILGGLHHQYIRFRFSVHTGTPSAVPFAAMVAPASSACARSSPPAAAKTGANKTPASAGD